MPQLPEKLPEGGKPWWARLARAFNDLRDYVDSLKPQETINSEIEWNSLGVAIRPKAAGTGTAGEDGEIPFKGQWSSDSAYDKDDIVIRALPSEIDDGNLIGTFIANQDIESGAVEAAGEVPSFPLHSGSKWDLFSIVPNTKFVLRSGDQTIEIVSGDSQGTTDAKISLNKDRTADAETGPRIILDLGDCGDDIIKVRRVDLCEVDVNTGIPTPGYRLFACGPFHAS